LRIIKSLGGRCRKCGCNDVRVLQVNHIGGGGIKELRTRISKMRGEILRGERKDLDILCSNCNIIYEFERGKRKIPADILELFSQFILYSNTP
jgi:hypothetical protein